MSLIVTGRDELRQGYPSPLLDQLVKKFVDGSRYGTHVSLVLCGKQKKRKEKDKAATHVMKNVPCVTLTRTRGGCIHETYGWPMYAGLRVAA